MGQYIHSCKLLMDHSPHVLSVPMSNEHTDLHLSACVDLDIMHEWVHGAMHTFMQVIHVPFPPCPISTP